MASFGLGFTSQVIAVVFILWTLQRWVAGIVWERRNARNFPTQRTPQLFLRFYLIEAASPAFRGGGARLSRAARRSD